MEFPLRSVFVAIPLEGEAKKQFKLIQSELESFSDCLRLQNPHTPHLTLQYWPEIMDIEYKQIIEQANKITAAQQPFNLQIIGVDTFSNKGQDRVIYLNVPFSEELARLKKICPWPSGNPFKPHITLARIKHPQRFALARKNIFKLLQNISITIKCDKLRLYAETDGKKQAPLQDFNF